MNPGLKDLLQRAHYTGYLSKLSLDFAEARGVPSIQEMVDIRDQAQSLAQTAIASMPETLDLSSDIIDARILDVIFKRIAGSYRDIEHCFNQIAQYTPLTFKSDMERINTRLSLDAATSLQLNRNKPPAAMAVLWRDCF